MDWDSATPGFRARVKDLTGPLPAEREGVDVKEERLHEAVELAVDFHSALAYHVVGYVRAALGEDELALDSLRLARDLAPGDLGIAFTLAKRYAAREQFDLAVEECQRALSRGDADLVDPQLNAVFESRHLEPSKEARISTAKNGLKQLLISALSKIAIPMARDRWNGMSEETRRSFLTVGIDEMVAYYCAKPSDECQMSALTGAVDFVKDNREWICWLCPQCEMTFLTAKTFQLHVEDDEFSRTLGSSETPMEKANKTSSPSAFGYPSKNDSHLVSGLLVSIAAPLDINPVYEGLHSECKYTMVSAEFDSWEKVLEEYSRSSFCSQIIFFERIDPVSEAAGTEVTV
uniref:DUF629 domain-containing protein n=1 Tax=Oryza meridionalis TaxID=40149 RepID=A0A0E0F7G6_9ORYZ